jgi:hypothetical protein
MIIFYRKELLPPGFYPFLLFNSAAIRTMPVSATMILIFYITTFSIIALIHMIA